MANEITASGSLSVAKGNLGAESLAVSTLRATMAGTKMTKIVQSIPTTAGGTALDLGNAGSVGWFFIKNLDATNYVTLLDAVSGTQILKILPGEFALARFAAGITAPAALANTAACLIESLLCEL